MPLFSKYLFSTPCIADYLTKSKSNIIINELEVRDYPGPEGGMESVGFATVGDLAQRRIIAQQLHNNQMQESVRQEAVALHNQVIQRQQLYAEQAGYLWSQPRMSQVNRDQVDIGRVGISQPQIGMSQQEWSQTGEFSQPDGNPIDGWM